MINGSNEEIPSSLPNLKIGDMDLQFVTKSRVLGVIIDNDLTFSNHANDILKRCWFQWYKVTKGTTRLYGLNTPSLLLLLKTLVLTKPHVCIASMVTQTDSALQRPMGSGGVKTYWIRVPY